MRNKIKLDGKNVIILVMNAVIVILCFFTLLCGYMAVEGYRDAFSAPYSENSLYYQLEDGLFYRMVESHHYNTQEGHSGNLEMQEYYGVAKFYEAASMYKAFLVSGDQERAERELEKMELAREEMGEWNIVEPEILEQLKIK